MSWTATSTRLRPRHFTWRVSPGTYSEYKQLTERIYQILDPSDRERLELEEQVRALPNFPREARDIDIIDIIPERQHMSYGGQTHAFGANY